jgi:hypothetical protein
MRDCTERRPVLKLQSDGKGRLFSSVKVMSTSILASVVDLVVEQVFLVESFPQSMTIARYTAHNKDSRVGLDVRTIRLRRLKTRVSCRQLPRA